MPDAALCRKLINLRVSPGMSNEEVTGFAGRVEHLELQHIIQIACLAGI